MCLLSARDTEFGAEVCPSKQDSCWAVMGFHSLTVRSSPPEPTKLAAGRQAGRQAGKG